MLRHKKSPTFFVGLCRCEINENFYACIKLPHVVVVVVVVFALKTKLFISVLEILSHPLAIFKSGVPVNQFYSFLAYFGQD